MFRLPALLHRIAAPGRVLRGGRRFFSLNSVNCVNFALAAVLAATPALARDSLGVFAGWGAFRDRAVPRCYAIAMAEPSTLKRNFEPYAAIGTWPKRGERGQVHFHLSRQLGPNSRITLTLSGQRFELVGGGSDAWAADKRMDAAIVATLRSAQSMTVGARDVAGRYFSNTYQLSGAATAIDAAALGCSRV
jgi:hypothetical protein